MAARGIVDTVERYELDLSHQADAEGLAAMLEKMRAALDEKDTLFIGEKP